MKSYNELIDLMIKNKLLSPIWKYILTLLYNELDCDEENKYDIIIFLSIYFSLVDDGNVCISLDTPTALKKWEEKYQFNKIILESNDEYNEEEYNLITSETNECLKKAIKLIELGKLNTLIGEKKTFDLENNYLYLKKYNVARLGIKNSLNRIFSKSFPGKSKIDYKNYVIDNFKLSKGQEKAVIEGFNKNLVVTGGPGTGKTTSILFLLINLLNSNQEYNVYLTAPSGKAANRMKESIINSLKVVKESSKDENKDLFNKINNLDEATIHRLLSYQSQSGKFDYNDSHRFSENSIFIIDEASMIDICIFNSLLQAIPENARVYIMGDKNQLPSVECGAVFGELLKLNSLKENIVELDESKRFGENTDIYKFARVINDGTDFNDSDYILTSNDFKNVKDFKIENKDPKKPIFFYKKDCKPEEFNNMLSIWGEKYYKNLQKEFYDINIDEKEDVNKYLSKLFEKTEVSKILCAENNGPTGVNYINNLIKKLCIDKTLTTSIEDCYTGQIMMINKNNKLLDLYNGDSGVLVKFNGDDTLYFMAKKKTKLVEEDKQLVDRIFKLGDYMFYPLRMITKDEIDLAYAITIHKSQGSDYENILVILPDKKGHPLLNRQIVYTAVTRTKGNTYIVSELDRIVEAKDRIIIRDTNIED